jgi:hypothetical protein
MNIQRSLKIAGALAALCTPVLAASDPYEALKAINGRWSVTRDKTVETIENTCAKTGLFYVCEQAVRGKPAALVVFLPRETGGRRLVFHTQTLTAAGDKAGPWHELTIEGDHWVYGDIDTPRRGVRRERTLNSFSGPDFIHFEVQSSTDGDQWTTRAAGDEHRAP